MTLDETDDTNDIKPSNFDLARLEDMSIGDKIEQERGNWKVLRYKTSYVLMLENSPKKKNFTEYQNLNDLIEFLNK